LARACVLLCVALVRVALPRPCCFGGALLERFLRGSRSLSALHRRIRGGADVRARLGHAGDAKDELATRATLTPRRPVNRGRDDVNGLASLDAERRQ
jgi:hypothetical protein